MLETPKISIDALVEGDDEWTPEGAEYAGYWRHGHRMLYVVQRKSDGAYFGAVLRVHPEGSLTDSNDEPITLTLAQRIPTFKWLLTP